MGTTLSNLLTKGPVLMDGGMGTTLQELGVDIDNRLWGSSALLSDEGRRLNEHVHGLFAQGGAQVLIANTHNASLGNCEHYLHELSSGVPPRRSGEELMTLVNREAVESCRKSAASTGALVAACVCSPERPYATEASFDASAIARQLSSQVKCLRKNKIDLLIYEMMTTRSDLEGVARIARAPFAVGLACGPDATTLGGVKLADAVAILTRSARPEALFIQCTHWRDALGALQELVRCVPNRLPVGVYANDGREWRHRRWAGERISPADYAAVARTWLAAGARIIGGCCGIGPDHISALAQGLRGV